MASEDDAIWHVIVGETQRGPIRRSEVLASVRDGTMTGAELVWRPGYQNWLALREVREFWVPPPSPLRQPEIAPPPLPEADAPTKRLDERWSLWGAATGGLALSSIVLWTSGLANRSYILASTGYMPNAELVGELVGELLALPLLFVLVALTRNIVRRRSLRPSTRSAGRRAAAFFGILIAVGFSLWIFGTLYFSRDEVIGGEARDDLVKSFVAGCFRSQRAAAVNAGFTERQIDGYCNCIGSSVVSTVTYKRLGSAGFEEDFRRAVLQTAPSCQVKP